MPDTEKKCVVLIDEELPLGMIANTAAILGITLGKYAPGQVGQTVVDASEKEHLGIITIPVSVLRGTKGLLSDLREKLYSEEYKELVVVDFSDVAQSCNVYEEYMQKAACVPACGHTYLGLAIYGNKKSVNRLTGSMPLLR